jgi:hypothetical protein
LRCFLAKYNYTRPRPTKVGTMKSRVPKAYRSVTPSSVTPNGATAAWNAAAVVTGVAVTDDKEESEEEDCVGDDQSKNTSDEEYLLDDIDDNSDESNDEEEEDTWREVDEDPEKGEGKQKDGKADEDRLNSTDTNVYLGNKGVRSSGSQDYRNTIQRLAKTHSFFLSDHFFDRLLEKHKANAFRIFNPRNCRWRKASLSEIRNAVICTLKGVRERDKAEAGASRGGGGKKRKSFPKVASRPRRDDYDDDEVTDNGAEWDYDDYESDQDKKPAATERKAAKFQVQKKTHAKKRPPSKTRGLDSKLKLDKLTEKYIAELKKLKEEASKSNDPEVYGEGKEILNRIVQMEEGQTKRGI